MWKGVSEIMYTFKSRIRYSETDESGTLSVTGIINYLQDCSTFHSEDRGVGIEYLQKEHKMWMLTSWKIEIIRRPRLGENITVGTWPYRFKGIYGFRNFVIWDKENRELVRADSTWFLCDTETGRPIRVRESDVNAYGAEEPRLDMEPMPRKIILPSEYEEGTAVTVCKHHIDTNNHVNNAQYVEIAKEAWNRTESIQEICVEYKRQAVLGDILIPHIGRQAKEDIVALCDKEGHPYAVVALRCAPPN